MSWRPASFVAGCVALLLAAQHAAAAGNVVYSGNILGACEPGQVFVISGTSPTNSFYITLRADASNFPLQIAVAPRSITRHARRNGGVTTKETSENLVGGATQPYNPIKRGQPFKFYIFVGTNSFWLAIDDKPYANFSHAATGLAALRSIEIGGDVTTLHQVDHRTSYPVACPSVLRNADPALTDFSNDIPRRLRPGHRIDIQGVPMAGGPGGQFVLELFEDTGRAVVSFRPHFGARSFVAISGLNARGTRLVEQRYDGRNGTAAFPFARGRDFRLALVVHEDRFVFSVQSVRTAQYQYQMACAVMFSRLNGFRIRSKDGMRVRVRSVQHTQPSS